MIFSDTHAPGTNFRDNVEMAAEIAGLAGVPVAVIWSAGDVVVVRPGMSAQGAVDRRAELDKEQRRLDKKLTLTITKSAGETDRDWVERGVELADHVDCCVKLLIRRKRVLVVKPGTDPELALYLLVHHIRNPQ